MKLVLNEPCLFCGVNLASLCGALIGGWLADRVPAEGERDEPDEEALVTEREDCHAAGPSAGNDEDARRYWNEAAIREGFLWRKG